MHETAIALCHPAVASRQIKFGDQALLWALAPFFDHRSGRVKVTLRFLAKELNIAQAHLCGSMKRLKTAGLVRNGHNARTGDSWFVLHPDLLSSGEGKERCWSQWHRCEQVVA